jgi:tyrosine-protein phosphatase SIW14
MSSLRRLPIVLVAIGLPVFAGDVPGIKNFDKVDNHVYRGGQPTDQGFKYLAQLGVKTIVDLREADGRATVEHNTVTAAGMTYVNVPMTGLTPPTDAEISKILAILEDVTSGPVFVHCKRGADRTGAVIAAYHINHDKWDNGKALKDAMNHKMSFLQFPRQGFIKGFQPRTIDAAVTQPVAAPAAAVSAAAAPGAAVAPAPGVKNNN